jgi:hypothetical protein
MKSSDLSVVTHELKVLENVLTVSDLVPSIIDYAVNVGLKETSAQWVRYLEEEGSLCEDVRLGSVVDRSLENDDHLSVVFKDWVR